MNTCFQSEKIGGLLCVRDVSLFGMKELSLGLLETDDDIIDGRAPSLVTEQNEFQEVQYGRVAIDHCLLFVAHQLLIYHKICYILFL